LKKNGFQPLQIADKFFLNLNSVFVGIKFAFHKCRHSFRIGDSDGSASSGSKLKLMVKQNVQIICQKANMFMQNVVTEQPNTCLSWMEHEWNAAKTGFFCSRPGLERFWLHLPPERGALVVES
jgi:hypothetical protein